MRPKASRTSGLVLSLVLACALLVLQNVEYWVGSWEPRPGSPASVSIRLPAFSVYRMHLGQAPDQIRRQVLVGRGEVLEPNEEARLVQAHFAARARGRLGWPLGMFCVSLVAALLFTAQLRRNQGPAGLLRAQLTLVGLVLLLLVGAKVYFLFTGLPAFYYPLASAVLLVDFVFDRRTAMAVNLFASALVASLLGFDLSAFVVFFTTGFAGTLFVRHRKRRRVVLQAGSLAGWFAALALLVLMLVFQGTIHVPDLLNPEYSGVLAALVGGVFSGILAWVLVGPVAWVAGKVSRGKLLDLQDLDHPLLKRIRERAPGTWEHSRSMANLGEAAAAAIGADSLLVRVGAYVHDAGKTFTPEYFIENQSALETANPHDALSPEVSAECIFDHVVQGTKLLRKHGVPEAVVEFAYTHHGTSLLEYFWIRNMERGNPEGLREKDFSYPGLRPATREAAILMLVDAIEAASRTIKPPEKSRFESLVQRIVFSKLSQGQLDQSGLSLADLKVMTTIIVDTLVNTYHARIEYPWQRRDETTGPQQAVSQTGPQQAASQTGPQQAVFQTGPQAVSQTGQHEVVSQTGPRTVSRTGQHEVVSQAGPQAVPLAGRAEAGSPAGPTAVPAEPPPEPSTRLQVAHDRDDPATPWMAAQPAVVQTGSQIVGGPTPGGAAGEDLTRPRRRRRVHTDPGLGAPVLPRADRDNGPLAADGAALPPSPFPPADDTGVQGLVPAAGEAEAEPRKLVGERS